MRARELIRRPVPAVAGCKPTTSGPEKAAVQANPPQQTGRASKKQTDAAEEQGERDYPRRG